MSSFCLLCENNLQPALLLLLFCFRLSVFFKFLAKLKALMLFEYSFVLCYTAHPFIYSCVCSLFPRSLNSLTVTGLVQLTAVK